MSILLVITVFFGLLTVMVALYLIKLTKYRIAWIILSLGLLLAALLRVFWYLNVFIQNSFLSSPYLTPVIALMVSVLFFIGLYLIIPVFKSIKVSESRYWTIFDSSGVSLWEEDLTGLYTLLEDLKTRGVTNIRDYITEHPEFIEEAVRSIRVNDVNQFTLDLFKGKNKKILLNSLGETFTDTSVSVFTDYLVSVFIGEKNFESETQYKDMEGSLLDAILKINNPGTNELRKNSIVSITDISARAKAEKKLLAVLEEKNTLLKELYHRTKNNMQVIIAMLNLRSNSLENEVVSAAFNDMIGRIQSMALVHEKLYKSDNLSVIKLNEYIEELLSLLVNTDTIFNSKIKILKTLDPISVDIDRAIPFGLILNELISNIYKHGFKNMDSGEIRISLNKLENHRVEFIVEDNGNGLPANFDVRNSDTLGLQTVFALGEDQLHGSVDFLSPDAGSGCSWHIVFDNKPRISRI